MPAEDGEGRRCNCCFRFIMTVGFTALFLWLSLRTNNPTLSIEDFSVFALTNRTTTTTSNRTIFFDLKLKNRNKDKGVYYDALNLTFSYNDTAVGKATFPPFYQGHEHSAHRPLAIEAEAPARWMPEVGRDGVVVFRVDLATGVRFKVVFWKTKRKRVRLGADLPVNGEGKLVKERKKGVKLTSGACCYRALPFWVVVVPALWWAWDGAFDVSTFLSIL